MLVSGFDWSLIFKWENSVYKKENTNGKFVRLVHVNIMVIDSSCVFFAKERLCYQGKLGICFQVCTMGTVNDVALCETLNIRLKNEEKEGKDFLVQ